jgi:hypothetical protein
MPAKTSVRRIGESIVVGVASDDPEDDRKLADRLIEWVKPVELRITSVDYGIITVRRR